MANNKIESIEQLCSKMKKDAERRCNAGEEFSSAHVLLSTAFEAVGKYGAERYDADHDPSGYFRYISEEFEFCSGFLFGLLGSCYITKDELELLLDEFTSVYDSHFMRMKQRLEKLEEKGAAS